MCWFLLLIHFSILQLLYRKVTFSTTQKSTPPTVFNLQALDWVHCEEETGVHYEISRHTYKLVFCFLQTSKVIYFAKKTRSFQKIP